MASLDSGGPPSGRSVPSNPDTDFPASCPTCQSSSIATTAKTPDSSSYWRCTTCGEVWNDSRRQAARRWR